MCICWVLNAKYAPVVSSQSRPSVFDEEAEVGGHFV